jgi:hypothetical protein
MPMTPDELKKVTAIDIIALGRDLNHVCRAYRESRTGEVTTPLPKGSGFSDNA